MNLEDFYRGRGEDYPVIIGMFIGGMLPFLFSAMTMQSVSKAAYQMIEEVRRI